MFTNKCATFTLLLFISLFYHTGSIFSQIPGLVTCNTTSIPNPSSVFNVGRWKPSKTQPVNNVQYFLRVLVVFVEFKNDSTNQDSPVWPPNTDPIYMDNLFAENKQLGLNAYSQSDETVSDYFNWISNDQFDVIADVFRIVLPKEYSQYSGFSDTHLDVFRMLDTNLNYNIDWSLYDNWKWNYATEEFERTPDDTLDMMIIQHRHQAIFGYLSGGFAGVEVNYSTLQGNKKIDGSYYSYRGSGVTQLNGATISKESFIGLFSHEYCHFMLGAHRPYSRVAGDDGTERIMGYELALSPQDMISVGYANTSTFNGSSDYTIHDMITTGEVLKIPTPTSSEYFLVCNRQKQRLWDCNMGGDTAMGLPFSTILEDKSKGLYIYHISGGNDYDAWPDLECADGLWNWEHLGTTTPDWHASQTLAVLGKTGVGYNDDNPTTPYFYDLNRLLSRDGMSVVSQTSYEYPAWGQKWFSTGKRHTCIDTELCKKGTDRVYTNLEELWTAREHQGDRWDAWKNNYNEVFSPYSSPNTKDRGGNQTGIFIFLDTILGGEATIKVYQAAANTKEEDVILAATPPSKPMLYRPVEVVNCNGTFGYPQITWDNNLEPDMESTGLSGVFKRYKIYRAYSANSNVAPLSYTYIATYDDYTPGDPAVFIDNNPLNGAIIYCSDEGNGGNDTYFRYHIVAVDSYNYESVPSDFVSIKGHSIIPDRPGHLTEEPSVFELSQNYPNPFNPSTQIKFALPQNTFVTVKVYNAIGEEVARLVNNEFKSAGSYSVTFDGSNFGSGIYFYSIEAGQYKETKKMVLIK